MFIFPECAGGNIDRTPRIVQASYRTRNGCLLQRSFIGNGWLDPSAHPPLTLWERGPRSLC